MRMLIPGLPVDDAANRAWATRLGQDWHPWPVPAAGSVPMRCENCGGAVLVDPESEGIRQDLVNGGNTPVIFCLMCCARLLRIEHITASAPARDVALQDGFKRLREDPAFARRIEQIAAEAESGPEKEQHPRSRLAPHPGKPVPLVKS